jgi:hypothetical protein
VAPINTVKERFHREGFVKLTGLISPAVIDRIREKRHSTMESLVESLSDDDGEVSALMEDPELRLILNAITERRLIVAPGIGVVREREKHTHLSWRSDARSFRHRAEDFGCTLWLPLMPINTKVQGGGLALVPRNVVCGRFLSEFIDPAVSEFLRRQQGNNRQTMLQLYLQLRDGILNDPSMSMLLEEFASVDDFLPGDALLFHKYVIHRNAPLRRGPLDHRAACAMRFIASS